MSFWVRLAVVLLAATYVAFLAVCVALVQFDDGENRPRLAKLWPGHPTVLLESGLAEVGAEAAAGGPVDPALVTSLLAVSAKAPLAPEPFLVRGVDAQLAGNPTLALSAFLAARQRSPRTIATRYFLADHYLKSGQTGQGLAEISSLARLVPQSIPSIAPYLAAFAKSPGAAPQLRDLLRRHPQLEPMLLETLSADPSNANLVLKLWNGRRGEREVIWQSRLLSQMIEAGHYHLARQTWSRFSGDNSSPSQLFDPDFAEQALPPFGWSFSAGPAGLAESKAGGQLHVLFYGRDDVVLASQMLTLSPGIYRLSMSVGATALSPNALRWTVKCVPSSNEVALIPLGQSGRRSEAFEIPRANCQAQRLELSGSAQQLPRPADITISELRLRREAPK